jgi:hypothetical protein
MNIRVTLAAAAVTGVGLLGACVSPPRAPAAPASAPAAATANPANASTASDAGWLTLLDPADPATLRNWDRIGEDNWRIEDGAVVADARRTRESSYLITKKTYADFELRAEVWVDSSANSGIFFRGLDPYRVNSRNAYEMNIYDEYTNPEYGTGSIANFAKVAPMPKAGGHWNTFHILAQGPHLVVQMNGTKTVDIVDSTFPAGLISLQYGGGVVKWRKVQIRPL